MEIYKLLGVYVHLREEFRDMDIGLNGSSFLLFLADRKQRIFLSVYTVSVYSPFADDAIITRRAIRTYLRTKLGLFYELNLPITHSPAALLTELMKYIPFSQEFVSSRIPKTSWSKVRPQFLSWTTLA